MTDRDEQVDQFDEFDQFDQDDELRALLRSSDPARSLSPAAPADVAHLLEDIMSTDLDVRPEAPEGTRATGTHGRSRVTWLVAAAAAVVIAGAGGYAVSTLSGSSDAPPTASGGPAVTDPGTSTGSDQALAPVAGTTELGAPSQTGRCAAPSAAFIAQQEQAFSGTVTSIAGGKVTLQTTGVYAGEVGETVQVSAPTAELRSLIEATDFQVGQTYLVSATGGRVSVCGFSGKATGELQSMYEKAFPR